MPPLVPTSMKRRPRAATCAARRIESFIVGVTSVDEDVVPGQERKERLDGGVHGPTRRHHHPDGPRRSDPVGDVLKRARPYPAETGEALPRVGPGIVTHHPVAAPQQTLGHVRAHPAETDQAQFHLRTPSPVADVLGSQPVDPSA